VVREARGNKVSESDEIVLLFMRRRNIRKEKIQARSKAKQQFNIDHLG
jgi:hypothetical protein